MLIKARRALTNITQGFEKLTMIVSTENIELLKSYIANIEALVASDDVKEVLDAIDDVIVDNMLENHEEPDDEGIALQKIYDEIFIQNQ